MAKFLSCNASKNTRFHLFSRTLMYTRPRLRPTTRARRPRAIQRSSETQYGRARPHNLPPKTIAARSVRTPTIELSSAAEGSGCPSIRRAARISLLRSGGTGSDQETDQQENAAHEGQPHGPDQAESAL